MHQIRVSLIGIQQVKALDTPGNLPLKENHKTEILFYLFLLNNLYLVINLINIYGT